ncbi:capsule assembly Wzi family protein [Brucepastera parasyntrophica]|uniref:capsule assembly Wzi family protein n=1 Tax=Brucepastera parasyntrophica TaxID=2880008 RepID=UPI00210CDA4D|nr:capsule assembly Wzi family protein [Brucepastera parasyntrophica]ULQ60040.1 capsule assembly Wzi family protein [Brucepastera parasyntrophica]
MIKRIAGLIFFFTSLLVIFAQEQLLSDTETYYDFLSLQGIAERPYLNYRTLSDSEWTISEDAEHPWQEQNLGTFRNLFAGFRMRIYGPDVLFSYNTAVPYGQNDSVLWQGKGFNAYLTGGVRFEGYGLELTLKPEFSFSQNQAFELVPFYMDGQYADANYAGKAGEYGYFGLRHIDAPQRFGDSPFFSYSWGDSEIRYTWKTLTIGFGTQNIWLGPAKVNPLLHSNNAAPYPKLDIGLRKQPVTIFGWYAGDVEFRTFWGKLTESDYFDNDSSNDGNLVTGVTFSYAPSFLSGLVLGVHRTMLSKWSDLDYRGIFTLLWPFMETSAGTDERDQRASITLSYIFPSVGFEVYAEWGRNDYSPNLDMIIRYPFHTQAYTLGAAKSIRLNEKHNISGLLTLEITNLESSRDYSLTGVETTFYAHHIIKQGYTNRGQWLGPGIGTGGNSQLLSFDVYYPRGKSSLLLQRRNPDNDYVWYYRKNTDSTREYRFRTDLSIGINTLFHILKNQSCFFEFVFTDIHNYKYEASLRSVHTYNCSISAGYRLVF